MLSKKREVEVVPEAEFQNIDSISGDKLPPDPKPQWTMIPWDKNLIQDWKTDPNTKDEFNAYCESIGFQTDEIAPALGATAQNIPKGGLDLTDPVALQTFITGFLASSSQLATKDGMGEKGPETQLVKFPDSIDVTFSNGKVLPMPIFPINFAQEDYQSTGYYRKEVAEYLNEEIKGARFVKIPDEAAFVEHVFVRKDANGKPTNIREMFLGPGVFACRSLAESLEQRLAGLVEIHIPDGAIPGSQTTHDDMVTNGVRFATGFKYLVPVSMRDDLVRRIREHEDAFQSLGREKKGGALHGAPGSGLSGAQISAAEAQQRANAGVSKEMMAGEIASTQIPAGVVGR